ncbi:MAG: hypothetical protein WCG93_05430 [Paludibacter sp.]
MKTIKNILIILLVATSTIINAQEISTSPKVNEMHAQKWKYMVEQAKLTQKEVDAVLPVFMEYEKSVWNLHDTKRDFFKTVQQMEKNSKPNYSQLNDQYFELEINQAQLFKNYHLKLRKLLSPETLFNYYKAERAFKRKLLQDMPNMPQRTSRPN